MRGRDRFCGKLGIEYCHLDWAMRGWGRGRFELFPSAEFAHFGTILSVGTIHNRSSLVDAVGFGGFRTDYA